MIYGNVLNLYNISLVRFSVEKIYWLYKFPLRRNKLSSWFAYGILGTLVSYILSLLIKRIFCRRNRCKDTSYHLRRVDKYTTGLINNKNDCFINSSIQALVSLQHLTLYLNKFLEQVDTLKILVNFKYHLINTNKNGTYTTDGKSTTNLQCSKSGILRYKEETTTSIDDRKNLPIDYEKKYQYYESLDSNIPDISFHEELSRIIYTLQRLVDSNTSVSTHSFLDTFRKKLNIELLGTQNDVHELTQLILQSLEQENKSLKDFIQKQSLSHSISDFPIKGRMADHLVCLNCGKSSKINTYPFIILTLHVPQTNFIDLNELISKNQAETIEGYSCLSCKIKAILLNETTNNIQTSDDHELDILNQLRLINNDISINDVLSNDLENYINTYQKYGCNTSMLKSVIVKKTAIIDSPKILIFHLSRSVFYGNNYIRNSCNVEFKRSMTIKQQLIADNTCIGIKEVNYKLKSVITHRGSHQFGHYICYRHKPRLLRDIETYEIINNTPTITFGTRSTDLNTQNCISSPLYHSDTSPNNFVSLSSPKKADFNGENAIIGKGLLESYDLLIDDYTNGPPNSNDYDDLHREEITQSPLYILSATQISSQDNVIIKGFPYQPTLIAGENKTNICNVKLSDVHSTNEIFVNNDTTVMDVPRTVHSSIKGKIKKKFKKVTTVKQYPWWKISDDQIKEITLSSLLNETKSVYVLYYERID